MNNDQDIDENEEMPKNRRHSRVFPPQAVIPARPNVVRPGTPNRVPLPFEIPARPATPQRAPVPNIPLPMPINEARPATPQRGPLQIEIPVIMPPNPARPQTPRRLFIPNIPEEEILERNPEMIQRDAIYVDQQVRMLLTVVRHLYRAVKVTCWIILVLFFLSLLSGFLFPSDRIPRNPRLSLRFSTSQTPSSPPVWDLGFPLSTEYPFMFLLTLGFMVAFCFLIDYFRKLLVKIAGIAAAVQIDYPWRRRP